MNDLDVWGVAEEIGKSKASIYRAKKAAIEHLAKVEGVN